MERTADRHLIDGTRHDVPLQGYMSRDRRAPASLPRHLLSRASYPAGRPIAEPYARALLISRMSLSSLNSCSTALRCSNQALAFAPKQIASFPNAPSRDGRATALLLAPVLLPTIYSGTESPRPRPLNALSSTAVNCSVTYEEVPLMMPLRCTGCGLRR